MMTRQKNSLAKKDDSSESLPMSELRKYGDLRADDDLADESGDTYHLETRDSDSSGEHDLQDPDEHRIDNLPGFSSSSLSKSSPPTRSHSPSLKSSTPNLGKIFPITQKSNPNPKAKKNAGNKNTNIKIKRKMTLFEKRLEQQQDEDEDEDEDEVEQKSRRIRSQLPSRSTNVSVAESDIGTLTDVDVMSDTFTDDTRTLDGGLFVLPDSTWDSSFATTQLGDISGVPSVAEQEILASIQKLQQKLQNVRDKKEAINDDHHHEHVDPPTLEEAKEKKGRLIVVSNRLPVTVSFENDDYQFLMSSGGLVTAIAGTREKMGTSMDFKWIGSLGNMVNVPEEDRATLRERLREEHDCLPVFLEPEIADKYYNGFCNDVLWPLFHYEPLPCFKVGGERKFEFSAWDAYQQVNRAFQEAIAAIYTEGDIIWIHDYHLMLLPSLLRQDSTTRNARVGWFLHIPFPSSEVYRILPVREQILEGLLSADLLGFHTYDYVRHFLSSCTNLLGLDVSPRRVQYKSHICHMGVYPIGIDPSYFKRVVRRPITQKRIAELAETFIGQKIIIGVDRIDYIKGIPHKLLAFELFLKRYPEYIGKIVLIQIGVPSRTQIRDYQRLSDHVNELVGRINGRYGNLSYDPIHYIRKSVTQEELCALYNIADVAVVSSIRDGMNLVSHEYIAAQSEPCPLHRKSPGVLILSEFAGSAQSLSGALRINPWNTSDVVQILHQGLTLTESLRQLRHDKLFRYIRKHTSQYWAEGFVAEVVASSANTKKVLHENMAKNMIKPMLNQKLLALNYRNTRRRLLIVDYGGTLIDHESLPKLMAPSQTLKRGLKSLVEDPNNIVVLMSERSTELLDIWFPLLQFRHLWIIAEDGLFIRRGATKFGERSSHRKAVLSQATLEQFDDHNEGRSEAKGVYEKEDVNGIWECLDPSKSTRRALAAAWMAWKKMAVPVMQYFSKRTPGSFVDVKRGTLAFHYENSDRNFAHWQANHLVRQLEEVVTGSGHAVDIISTETSVLVRPEGVSKLTALFYLLNSIAPTEMKTFNENLDFLDFIFAAGDSRTDEDVFQYLRSCAGKMNVQEEEVEKENDEEIYICTVRVGRKKEKATFATHVLNSIPELRVAFKKLYSVSSSKKNTY